MALSLRKPPKFKRKEYQRLGRIHPWDIPNEFVCTEEQLDPTDEELLQETVLELSVPTPRNRLHPNKGSSNLQDNPHTRSERAASQEFLSYEIQPEDTLQGIALKYGCSVAELKRVNNLIQDQDAFALREIKIPAREHSILFEIFSQTSASSSASSSKTFHVSIGRMMQRNSDQEPSLFLHQMDEDIQRMVEKARAQPTNDSDKQAALSSPRIQPLVKPYYDGANWGINWYCLLIVLLVVSVLAPVTYAIYFVTMVHGQNETTSNPAVNSPS